MEKPVTHTFLFIIILLPFLGFNMRGSEAALSTVTESTRDFPCCLPGHIWKSKDLGKRAAETGFPEHRHRAGR